MPRMIAVIDGTPRANQICETGAASSTCPMRSRLTRERDTSTPHLSHTTPLYRTRLYLPNSPSQYFDGPKIRSQNNPSTHGCCVRYLMVFGLVPIPLDQLLIVSGEASFKRIASK